MVANQHMATGGFNVLSPVGQYMCDDAINVPQSSVSIFSWKATLKPMTISVWDGWACAL